MEGALYESNGQFVSDVDYQLFTDSPTSLWGELRTKGYSRINDSSDYIIEFEDKRKCQCNLKKKVNAAVGVIPGSFVYSFKTSARS